MNWERAEREGERERAEREGERERAERELNQGIPFYI